MYTVLLRSRKPVLIVELNSGSRVPLRERGMILASVSQIAATVGEVGRPVVEALGRLLALLSELMAAPRTGIQSHSRCDHK